MLRKLLKYDFKEAKILLPFYGVSLALMIGTYLITLLLYFFGTNFLVELVSVIGTVLSIFSLIGVIIASMVFVVMHFGKQTIGGEGPLMFTLPVTVDEFLISKLISSVSIMLFSFIFTIGSIISIVCLTMGTDALAIGTSGVNPSFVALIIVMMFIYMILGMIMSLLIFYTSVGYSGKLVQNRLIGTVLMFVIINFAVQMTVLIFILTVGGLGMALFFNVIIQLPQWAIVSGVFGILFVLLITLCAVFYKLCRTSFGKKIALP